MISGTTSNPKEPRSYREAIDPNNPNSPEWIAAINAELDSLVEQAVVYSTLPQEYSTLTFRGEVVVNGGGAEERSEVMYCIEVRTYIYYKVHNGHSCIV